MKTAMVLDSAIKLVVSRCYQNARISVGGKRCLVLLLRNVLSTCLLKEGRSADCRGSAKAASFRQTVTKRVNLFKR